MNDTVIKVQNLSKQYRILSTPMYLRFLKGERDLKCSPWGGPNYNPQGWKGPCYLITDGHYKTFDELMTQTDWEKYENKRDPRCANCMVHCGYDPSGALGTNYQAGDNWKNFKYNFWPRPAPAYEGRNVNAFNGASIGKGHLAEANAAVKAGLAGAKSAFQANGTDGGSCGTGDTTQRDELLAKIKEAKRG